MSKSELADRLNAVKKSSTTPGASASEREEELHNVLHELEVAQIELEMQNRELIESRQAVDESHDKYLSLYDFAPVGYMTLNKHGQIKEVNLTAAGLLEVDRHKLVGAPLSHWIDYKDLPKFRQHLSQCSVDGDQVTSSLELRKRNGSLVPIQLLSKCVQNLSSAEFEIRSAVTDLTELKRVEEALRLAKETAERASEIKSAFLANMSHEIRTPLGAILGFTELLRGPCTPTEKEEYSDIVAKNGRALTRIIDDLLDLSKVEAGRLDLEFIEFRVGELVEGVVELFREYAKSKNLTLDVSIDPTMPTIVESDPTRLRQILINLIGNAVKFTSHGSVHIRVEPKTKDGSVSCAKFLIEDTGIGMTPEQADKLFIPFSQGDNTMTRKFGGSGLGLALSRRLARALGGDVKVQKCELGKGCLIIATVEFRSVKERPMSHDAPTRSKNLPVPRRNELRILLVEDSQDNQLLVTRLLSRYGIKIDIASNGEEGVEMAEANHYDVVLMDMQMPVLDGYKATEKLRHDGYEGTIVALTAHAMAEERKKILDLGCDAHLTKPLDSKVLIETIDHFVAGGMTIH